MQPRSDRAVDEYAAVRQRFLKLMDMLQAVEVLLKDGVDALEQYYDDQDNQPDDMEGEEELLQAMSPTDAFWRAWDAPPHLLPIACLAFGQAVFEAFLLDTLKTLSAARRLHPVSPRMGFQRILREYKARFGIEINPADKPRLDDFVATRNLWVHNAGIVTREYAALTREPLMPGEVREISADYVGYALWSFDDAARQIVRGLFGRRDI